MLLKEKDMNAGEIAEQFNISKPSISHHLDILKRADLVTSEKKGQFVSYAMNTTIVDDIFQWILTLKKQDYEIQSKKGITHYAYCISAICLPSLYLEYTS